MAPFFFDMMSETPASAADMVEEADMAQQQALFTPTPPTIPPPAHLLQLETATAATNNNQHQEGIFSPIVRFGKQVVGDAELNKIRGTVIAMHWETIKNFVDTAETQFGNTVLRTLYKLADRNGNGKIELEELEGALKTLGFRFLKENQVKGIFKRAGGEEKGFITMEEWMQEAPKTLKTNLVKLAKTNGGEFLA